MIIFKPNVVFLCIALSFVPAYPQTLSGKVFDADNGNALSNCNISVLGTNHGAITNENGYYFLALAQGTYTILFQYIGYKSDTIRIDISDKPIVKRNIALKRQILSSEDIVVFSSIYSEAEQLILRASEEKKKYLAELRNYSCRSYTKTTLYRKIKPNHIRYALLLEFYSRLFWNAPDNYYEIIESQKQSANLPQSTNIFSGNSFLNINSDRIFMGQKTIIGPTASDAIKNYHYEIIDTLYQDKERIFKIRITAKDNTIPLMNGFIFLVDKKFVLQKIDVKLNKQCNYGFYQNMHIVQQYVMNNAKLYVPYFSLNEGDWIINIPKYPKLKYRKENFRENYIVNNPANKKYDGQTKIVYENKIPFTAIPMNIPPLTASEKKGYVQIDSIVTHFPIAKFITNTFKLIDIFSYLDKQPIGKFSDFYRFNKVEGSFLGFAVNTKNLIKPFNLYGGFGRGFGDQKNKYFLQLGYKYTLSKFNFDVTFNTFDGIFSREEKSELPVWFNTFSSMLSGFDYFDYYYSKGHSVSLGINHFQFSFTSTLFSEHQTRTYNHYSTGLWSKNHFAPSFSIKEGQFTGMRFFLNYTTAGYRQTALSKELIQNQRYTEIYYGYETAFKGWGSISSYYKQQLLLYLSQNTFYNGFLDLTFYLADGSPTLPVQKYFELESGFSGYDRFKTFRTLDLNAYVGNKKVAMYFEHNFHNTIFQWSHLPYIQTAPLDLILIYNLGWAGNRAWQNVKLKDFYSEMGFGIGRLFSILKVEFLWRHKKYPLSNDFAFSVKMSEIEL